MNQVITSIRFGLIPGLLLLAAVLPDKGWAKVSKFGRSVSSQSESGAHGKDFGLGIMLGEPSGLSAKYWQSSNTAIDFGLTYAFGNYFAFLADYLWEFPGAIAPVNGSQFIPYVGVGAMMIVASTGGRASVFGTSYTSTSLGLAVRVPFGIEFLPNGVSLGVFAEIVPGLGLIPGMFGLVQGDVGVRFYF